jgi:hypothetical protein
MMISLVVIVIVNSYVVHVCEQDVGACEHEASRMWVHVSMSEEDVGACEHEHTYH